MRKYFFSQHADVHGVAIAFNAAQSGALGAESCHLLAAKRLGNEAVEGGTHRGKPLRTIHAQVPGAFVQFVLHRVGGNDLDIARQLGGGVFSGRNTMPGMSLEQ